MIWVFSSFAVFIALLLVLAASPPGGQVMFQFSGDALRESAQHPMNWLSFPFAVGVAIWFAASFGSWSSFSKPPDDLPELEQPRAFTTSMRYWFWSALYGVFLAAAFLIVVFFPQVAEQILRAMREVFGNDALLANVPLEGGLVTGVIIVLLFAKSAYEGQLRNFFHSRALIPEEARRIYEELTHTIFDFRPPDADLEEFLAEQRRNQKKPTYFEFEFDIDKVQQSDQRMELLPRIAFMSWQMARLRPKHAGFQALRRSAPEIDKLQSDVATFEANAMACKTQLLTVLDGLIELERAVASDPFVGANDADQAARSLDVAARVAADTDLNAEMIESQSVPVSRLDNVASALIDELETLGNRLGRYNDFQTMHDSTALDRLAQAARADEMAEDPAAFDHAHKTESAPTSMLAQDHARLTARLDSLRAQLAAVEHGLVPVARERLRAMDEKMEKENADLVALSKRFIGVIVCASLAADATPEREFFQSFGLDPTLGHVRFRFERALWLLGAPLILFLVVLIGLSVAGSVVPDFNFVIWFLVGTLFIAGSVIYGCVHGSAMASVQLEKRAKLKPNPYAGKTPPARDFTLVQGVSAFVFSTAFLVIGLYSLCLMMAMNHTDGMQGHLVFSGGWPFAAVAAWWSVVCAYVTVRVSLDVGPVIRRRDWLLFPFLTLLTIGLIFGFLQSVKPDLGVPWPVVVPLAAALTLALLAGARYVVQQV